MPKTKQVRLDVYLIWGTHISPATCAFYFSKAEAERWLLGYPKSGFKIVPATLTVEVPDE